MANSIAYAVAYLRMLDKIYKANSATAIMESANARYKWDEAEANSIKIRKMSLQGLVDYSRASGFTAGDTTLEWETHTFAQDRGRQWNLDAMDADEARTTIAEMMSEAMRTQIIPEVDAYRFEKICTLCGLDESADLTYDTAIQAIDTGIETLDDAEVPKDSRVCFVSNEFYKLMKQSGEFFQVRIAKEMDKTINREIEVFDGMPLVRVPKGRFYNDFDFATTGNGGFSVASGAKELNFIITDINSLIAVMKHNKPRLISPEYNATADGWLFSHRTYHDLFVPENKLAGTYIHSKA